MRSLDSQVLVLLVLFSVAFCYPNSRYNFYARFNTGYSVRGYISVNNDPSSLFENTTSTNVATVNVNTVFFEVSDDNNDLVQRGYSVIDGTSYDPYLLINATRHGNTYDDEHHDDDYHHDDDGYYHHDDDYKKKRTWESNDLILNQLDINDQVSEGNLHSNQNPYFYLFQNSTTALSLFSYNATSATSTLYGTAVTSSFRRSNWWY